MPLQIIRQDITKMECDAIVNAAKETLLGGGGVDGAIHTAAGPGLLEECKGLGGCAPGEAKLTGAYDLPCKYVIHTVGPRWAGGDHGEEQVLRSCYRSALTLAAERKLESIAFPLISAGIFGYPKAQAMHVAAEEIAAFLRTHEMTVYLVIFGAESYRQSRALFPEIQTYIDDHYTDAREAADIRRRRSRGGAGQILSQKAARRDETLGAGPLPVPAAAASEAESLAEFLRSRRDESFSQMLLRKIDETGITDVECYKRANIDRKLFSKIRNDVRYRPSKPTAAAFAVALRLPLDEARELLGKAGYALSHSSEFDLILEYFLRRGNCDVFEINEALFAFDQTLLGG